MTTVKALHGAIEHGSTYIKKGKTGSLPDDVARGLIRRGKAASVKPAKTKPAPNPLE